MRHRLKISPKQRYEALLRHDFTCFYCGIPARLAQLEIDHVIPHSMGGADEPWNLAPACRPCNLGKGASLPTPDMVERARDAFIASEDADHKCCTVCGVPLRLTPNESYDGGCYQCIRTVEDAMRYAFKVAHHAPH